jgi:anti-sigma factor RsiW
MADLTQHPTDALQDALDGRLAPEARAAFDAHVASCERCRRELEALRWTKAHVAAAADRMLDMPVDLDSRLREALDAEDRGSAVAVRPPSRWLSRRAPLWIAGTAAAAAVIVAFVWWQGVTTPTMPEAVAAHLRAFQADELALEIESSDPAALEAHLRATRAPATRVYDFGMMGITLVGARTITLADRPAALAAYRSEKGERLVCEMYAGRVDTLPSTADHRIHNDIDFFVYREAEVTVVFWQEGAIVCVLAGVGDPEAIVALAFAKAIKV